MWAAFMHFLRLIRCAGAHWAADSAGTLGAALAFYSAFSLAPLLVILVTVAGFFIGSEAANQQLGAQLDALFGTATARVLLNAMQASQQGEGTLATVVSSVTLIIGATTVFAALEDALERIWGANALVPPGVRGWLRSRLLSFGLILAVGFLLLVSLTISTALAAVRTSIEQRFAAVVILTGVLDIVISTGLIAGLFALVYRYMPARRLAWRYVLWGGLLTAVLFHAGRWAVGLYLARSTTPSAFGAAASFAALLLWLYYTAQIFLFSAEFTACLGGVRQLEAAKR